MALATLCGSKAMTMLPDPSTLDFLEGLFDDYDYIDLLVPFGKVEVKVNITDVRFDPPEAWNTTEDGRSACGRGLQYYTNTVGASASFEFRGGLLLGFQVLIRCMRIHVYLYPINLFRICSSEEHVL